MALGEPPDVDGECNARLYIGDNFGDNHATMRCQLAPGHATAHREIWSRNGTVTIEWETDEREKCHGCGVLLSEGAVYCGQFTGDIGCEFAGCEPCVKEHEHFKHGEA